MSALPKPSREFTHTSYKSAMSDLRKKKVDFARWDAGNNFVAEAYWHAGRIISVTVTPEGFRIV